MGEISRRELLKLLSAAMMAQASGPLVLASAAAQFPDALWERVARDMLPDVAASGHWIFDSEGGLSAAASGFKFLWETHDLRDIGDTELQRETKARIGAILQRPSFVGSA